MGAPEVSRRRAGTRIVRGCLLAAEVLGLVVAVAGCGAAGVQPSPGPSASASPRSSPTGSPGSSSSASPIPLDGAGLRTFGIENGPAEFSLPRTSIAQSVVDQGNNVVLVLSAPGAADVSVYLRRTLPGAGFTIVDADPDDATFAFEGHGWTGSFTRGDGVSAVLLRPR